jgi:hypothetical protein
LQAIPNIFGSNDINISFPTSKHFMALEKSPEARRASINVAHPARAGYTPQMRSPAHAGGFL